MNIKLYNHTTQETINFSSWEEFIYWFNYTDEHSEIQEVVKDEA